MDIVAARSVTVAAADPEATRRWYADALGLRPAEDDEGAATGGLAIGDLELRIGPQAELHLVAVGVEPSPTTLTDPAGTLVHLAAPDTAAAAAAEASVAAFIDSATSLPGPAVAEVADWVAAIVAAARDTIAEAVADVPHNKVLATQFELSRRARALGPRDSSQWPLHAASTLMSEFIIAGTD